MEAVLASASIPTWRRWVSLVTCHGIQSTRMRAFRSRAEHFLGIAADQAAASLTCAPTGVGISLRRDENALQIWEETSPYCTQMDPDSLAGLLELLGIRLYHLLRTCTGLLALSSSLCGSCIDYQVSLTGKDSHVPSTVSIQMFCEPTTVFTEAKPQKLLRRSLPQKVKVS